MINVYLEKIAGTLEKQSINRYVKEIMKITKSWPKDTVGHIEMHSPKIPLATRKGNAKYLSIHKPTFPDLNATKFSNHGNVNLAGGDVLNRKAYTHTYDNLKAAKPKIVPRQLEYTREEINDKVMRHLKKKVKLPG